MMKIFNINNWFSSSKKQIVEQKSTSDIFDLDSFLRLGSATWTTEDYRALAYNGYIKNVIVHHCISKISQAASDIDFYVTSNDKEVAKNDAIFKLLKRPNITQSYKVFFREMLMYRLISGNAFVHANIVSTNRIMELTNLRPDRVEIITNDDSMPIFYNYTVNGKITRYSYNVLTGESEVIHLKEPNPIDDVYGLSPICAARMAMDQHNEAGEWNKKLLENSARPPGLLAMKDRGDNAPTLTREQLNSISDMINARFSGYRNAGKIPVLNYDMEWRALGMSPADMDWINGKNTSARDICLAFGYPAFLLGMAEGATYNNVAEAKLGLYEETVIPLMQSTLEQISYYLSERSNKQIDICLDLDSVSALSPRREILRMNAREDMRAGIITPNEARAEIGYEAIDGGDELLKPRNYASFNNEIISDENNLSKNTYVKWLEKKGFEPNFIKKVANIAFESMHE